MNMTRRPPRVERLTPLRLLVRVAGWLSGCGCAVAVTACYGSPGWPAPHDPTVVLLDFSYTPASPIHVGETLTLTVTLNHTAPTGFVNVTFKNYKLAQAYLNDHGASPDQVAGDGVYTGAQEWGAQLGDGKGLPVWAELGWDDGTEGQRRDAPPLTVLPEEGGP